MLRDLKFRAWDKVCKEMFYSSELSNGDIMVLHLDGRIEISDDDTYKPEDFVLMQYTGLKDKNGVEIYEGDVVSYTVNDLPQIIFSEIVWRDNWPSFAYKRNETYELMSELDSIRLEVIGNVHQNPELLEGGVTP